MSLVLKAEHIRKSFGNVEVLKDINLSVEKGSVVSILGPSGTGKTTFLRCLNYLEKPDAGKLTISDVSVDFPIFPRRTSSGSAGNPPWFSSSSTCSATRRCWKM